MCGLLLLEIKVEFGQGMRIFFIAALLFMVAPVAVLAGDGGVTKISIGRGTVISSDASQAINDEERSLDTSDSGTYIFSAEQRFPSEGNFWSFGADYTTFEFDFSPADVGGIGIADNHIVMFFMNYYFDVSRYFHPYLGGGFGTCYSKVDDKSGEYDYHAYFGVQGKIGAEFIFADRFGLFTEAKWIEINTGGQDYDPGSYGFFAGVFWVIK